MDEHEVGVLDVVAEGIAAKKHLHRIRQGVFCRGGT